MVEADSKFRPIALVFLADARDQLLRRDAFTLGFKHNRRTVGIIGANEMHFVAMHALRAHPNVRLDIFHDVADVKRAVRVGQCSCNEELLFHIDQTLGKGEL